MYSLNFLRSDIIYIYIKKTMKLIILGSVIYKQKKNLIRIYIDTITYFLSYASLRGSYIGIPKYLVSGWVFVFIFKFIY